MAQLLGQQPMHLPHERALQVGLIIMMVILILSMITKAEADATERRKEEKA